MSLLGLACGDARPKADTPRAGSATAAAPQAFGPIPADGPLAHPKSFDQVGLPAALVRRAMPPDNPLTPAKVALGEQLFFDGRLSADGTVACASCHDPRLAFTDGRAVAVGVGGRVGQRNSPTVLNALFNTTQFWDGRAATLEKQAALPIVNPVEMGQLSIDSAVAHIAAVAAYQTAFRSVFGHAPTALDMLRAIAAYERSQVSFDSPFDHFMAGDRSAIEASAQRGWALFNGQAGCNKCHALSDTSSHPTNFTDNAFHNIGVGILRSRVVELTRQAERDLAKADTFAIDRAAIQTSMSALGRYLITRKESDIAAFKTPGLRNVMVTAPYFHDGSAATLWDVMDHYNKGDGVGDPHLDADIRPLALREQDIDDIVALMASLTSPGYRALAATELARQRGISRTARPERDSAKAFGPRTNPAKPPS